MGDLERPEFTMSIGAVSRATGIPVNTLRTWERRYDFPSPLRTEGGQRQYRPETVPRLRLISRALEMGHRPRQVLGLPVEQLRRMVGQVAPAASSDARGPIEDWLKAARGLDGETLDAGFRYECARMGVEAFLMERASPFLKALGDAWADGTIQVFQEHFASERLRDFLVTRWRPLSDRARGPHLICTTLPGERHFMGLHMISTLLALRGFRLVFLGADTPLTETVAGAEQAGALAVMISASSWADPEQTGRDLLALREQLSDSIGLVIGGRGALALDLEGVEGVRRLEQLRDLARWCDERGLEA